MLVEVAIGLALGLIIPRLAPDAYKIYTDYTTNNKLNEAYENKFADFINKQNDYFLYKDDFCKKEISKKYKELNYVSNLSNMLNNKNY